MTDDEIWDAFYEQYNVEPKNANVLVKFCQFNNITANYKRCRSIFNSLKGTTPLPPEYSSSESDGNQSEDLIARTDHSVSKADDSKSPAANDLEGLAPNDTVTNTDYQSLLDKYIRTLSTMVPDIEDDILSEITSYAYGVIMHCDNDWCNNQLLLCFDDKCEGNVNGNKFTDKTYINGYNDRY